MGDRIPKIPMTQIKMTSELTSWMADYTSWAGDIGSAIAIVRTAKTRRALREDDSFNAFFEDRDIKVNQ